MGKEMIEFRQRVQNADKAAVYCAGEFASFLIQYCSVNGLADKIEYCIVTKRDPYTPAYILGIPVVQLKDLEQQTDMLIIVAVLSEDIRQEIVHSLTASGYQNICLLSEREFRNVNESLADFSAEIKCKIVNLFAQNQRLYDNLLSAIQRQYENLSLISQNMPLVAETHKQSFGKYKDINQGRTVVICAPGPSLNQYTFNDNYVHIGLNALLFQDRIKLDYYFNQHIPSEYDFWGTGVDVHPKRRKKYLDSFSKLKCVKFIGQLIGTAWNTSPPFGEYSNSEYNTYYISDIKTTHNFCVDIRYNFLYGAKSVIFPALQFALFTNPKRILLVGCDGYSMSDTNYYSKEEDDYLKNEAVIVNKDAFLCTLNEDMRRIYKELQKFAVIRYPNTEIIMVNPVCYKGIFNEAKTDDAGRIMR